MSLSGLPDRNWKSRLVRTKGHHLATGVVLFAYVLLLVGMLLIEQGTAGLEASKSESPTQEEISRSDPALSPGEYTDGANAPEHDAIGRNQDAKRQGQIGLVRSPGSTGFTGASAPDQSMPMELVLTGRTHGKATAL